VNEKTAGTPGGFNVVSDQRSARHSQRPPSAGNPGDVKPVGQGGSELRIDYGLGYRLYFTQRGKTVVILLCGGDKRIQYAEIKRAIEVVQARE
jgi:putative addiction module killer protein